MTRNNKNYKGCTYFNNDQGALGVYWKDGHEECKITQSKKS